LLADGVSIRPILPRHGLVDHSEQGAAHGFSLIPDAALGQWNAKERKVFGADEVQPCLRLFSSVAKDFDARVPAVRRRCGVGGNAGGDDFGHGGDLGLLYRPGEAP